MPIIRAHRDVDEPTLMFLEDEDVHLIDGRDGYTWSCRRCVFEGPLRKYAGSAAAAAAGHVSGITHRTVGALARLDPYEVSGDMGASGNEIVGALSAGDRVLPVRLRCDAFGLCLDSPPGIEVLDAACRREWIPAGVTIVTDQDERPVGAWMEIDTPMPGDSREDTILLSAHLRGAHPMPMHGCPTCAVVNFSVPQCLMTVRAGRQCRHRRTSKHGAHRQQFCGQHADDATKRRARHAAGIAVAFGRNPRHAAAGVLHLIRNPLIDVAALATSIAQLVVTHAGMPQIRERPLELFDLDMRYRNVASAPGQW